MRQAVLYDFHGTLVNVSGIRHLLSIRNYDEFYEQSLDCPPIANTVVSAMQTHEAGFVNLLFTGMPDTYVEGLNRWLSLHRVPIDLIEMRKAGDYRKDFIIKRDMYLRAIDNGYYVVRAWEDNPRVAELWERQAIPVSLVPGWDEELVVDGVDKAPRVS
jgi:hypothetical protein